MKFIKDADIRLSLHTSLSLHESHGIFEIIIGDKNYSIIDEKHNIYEIFHEAKENDKLEIKFATYINQGLKVYLFIEVLDFPS